MAYRQKIIMIVLLGAILLTIGMIGSESGLAQGSGQVGDYTLLEPSVLGDQPADDFTSYAAVVVTTILVIIVALAILMFILGAIQYTFSSVPGSKGEGKTRMLYAIGGLVLALTSWLILYTVNPEILNFQLRYEGGTTAPTQRSSATPAGAQTIPGVNTPQPSESGDLSSEHYNFSPENDLLTNARAAQGLSTSNVPGTNNGRLACVYAANQVVEATYGNPINNSLSTAEMFQDLQTDDRFSQVSGGLNSAQPGDLIITPTRPGQTGHVGFCDTPGCQQILSNSSSTASFRQNFNPNTWRNYYGDEIYIFRPL